MAPRPKTHKSNCTTTTTTTTTRCMRTIAASCLFLTDVTHFGLAFSPPVARTGAVVASSEIISRFPRPLPVRRTASRTDMVADATAAEAPTTTAMPTAADDDAVEIPTAAAVSDDNAFSLLAGLAAVTLLQSDRRRDAVGKESGAQASSATNWVDEASAYRLQQALDRLKLTLADERTGIDRDEASNWIRWMKSTPTPLIVDLSREFQRVANETVTDEYLQFIDTSRPEFLSRIGCRLILLPSGAELRSSLVEPTGSFVYGKLLYGGARRYRLLPSSTSSRPPRRAGEQTLTKTSVAENLPSWIMYGGPERKYEAVDMGSAALIEVTLLPRGKELPSVFGKKGGDMALNRLVWNPQRIFSFIDDDDSPERISVEVGDESLLLGNTPMTLSGKERNDAFATDFRSAVGGLQPQIDAIVRRVLDGRIIRPADADETRSPGDIEETEDTTSAKLSLAAMEAEELALLGLSPVRGMLLYGPPGCGKTALAREISRALRARAPKIVSAPELLDRWVGGSEKLVRSLFAEAEAELAACNGDATRSALHVIVIDEIDAVFRKRSTADDSGEATRSSAVNQILAKLDGVNAIPNVLLIGMTNRRELLDEALLRPGRLEVQIEIPLPDQEGRREILNIHFDALRKRGRLSMPLCCAIDGVAPSRESNEGSIADDHDVSTPDAIQETGRKRRALKRAMNRIVDSMPVGKNIYDLAADAQTGGFSGADIAGLVRCAGSISLARARRGGGGVESLLITLDDVKQALVEVKK